MELLKEKLVQFFRFKMDGSRFYIGKPMPEVHENLGITDDVFDKACEVFVTSVNKMGADPDVTKTFIDRISGLRHDICFPPKVSDDMAADGLECDTDSPASIFLHMG